MNELIIGVACILGTLVVICVLFLIGVAIWQYCEGRYGENPFELFCDYFYEKGERRREKMPPELVQSIRNLEKRIQDAFGVQGHKKGGGEEEYGLKDNDR